MDRLYVHSKLPKLNKSTTHLGAQTHVQWDEYMIVAIGFV